MHENNSKSFRITKNVQCHFILAQKNLDVSRVLYETSHFAFAIFHLQQAVENGFKSYGEFTNAFTAKEKRIKISHQSYKILDFISRKLSEDILSQAEDLKDSDTASKIKEEYKKQITEMHKITANAKNFNIHNKNPRLELRKLIKQMKELDSELETQKKYLYSSKFQKSLLQNKEYIDELFAFLNIPLITDESWEDIVKSNMIQFSFALTFLMHLFVIQDKFTALSYILAPHENSSRYPMDDGRCPDEIYAKNNPLTIEFNSLSSVIEQSLNHLGRLIENYKKITDQSVQNSKEY